MTKLILFAALVVFGYRLVLGRWPWEHGKRVVRSRAEAQARVLLGVGDGAGREEIIEAHRRLLTQIHPDRGGTNELVHEANSARDVLLGALARRHSE